MAFYEKRNAPKIGFFFSLRPLTSWFLTTLLNPCSIEGNRTKQTNAPKNRFFLLSARLYYQVRPLRPLTTRFLFIRFLFTFFFTIFILIFSIEKRIKNCLTTEGYIEVKKKEYSQKKKKGKKKNQVVSARREKKKSIFIL